QLGNLQAGVCRIAAAVIEEVTNIMGLEYVDQTLVFSAVGFQAFQLVTARAESTGRRVAQGSDVFRRLEAGIDQVLGQGANNAIAASIDFTDAVRMLARSFNHPGSGGVDDCGYSA